MTLHRAGDPVTVELDGTEVTYLVPLEIVRSSGGQRLDYARFLYNLSQTGEHVENISVPETFDKVVSVRVNGELIFVGKLHRQDLDVGPGESVMVTASILPHDMGRPIDGMRVYDKRSDERVLIRGDLYFQPLIDGVIEDNRSAVQIDPENGAALWLDPDSVRTSEAETYLGDFAGEWELKDGIDAVATHFAAEASAGFVQPPDLDADPFLFDDATAFQNVRIPFGASYPMALDMLTHPFGYDWYVSPIEAILPNGEVVVYRQGVGEEKTVTMQAFGEVLDLETTNCKAFRLAMDLGQRFNKVHLCGSRKQWEMGIELYRGWPTADDALQISDLMKSDPDSQYTDKPDVWRLYVANEAGDYSGTRDAGAATIPDAPRDWSSFGAKYDTRRRAEDCLTRGPDGQRLPPQLEWSDDAGTTWLPVPDDGGWTWRPLESQLGVRFTGDVPPPELVAAGDDARLRICCTVTFDEALEKVAASEGLNADPDVIDADEVRFLDDVSDRYHYRQVSTIGDHASFVWVSGMDKDERDDGEALQTAADYMLEEVDGAEINGEITLIGIRTDYAIGDLITTINGRNVSLNRRALKAGELEQTPKYPQVTGLVWRFGDQQTTQLVMRHQHLDPWYRPGARPDGVLT